MRPRILVTRPEPGGSATARRLEEVGFKALVMPLTEIQDLAVDAMPMLAGSDAVVLTSANAIRYAAANLVAELAEKPCFAVGEETARTAREAGLRNIVSSDGDAAALTRFVIAKTAPSAHLAYLTGRIRRDGFEQALISAGRQLEIVETYDTVRIPYSSATLAQNLAGGIQAVLLYSGMAAEALADLPSAERHFGDAALFGLSERIGSALPAAWQKRFRAAGTPDEAALFRLLAAAFPPTP